MKYDLTSTTMACQISYYFFSTTRASTIEMANTIEECGLDNKKQRGAYQAASKSELKVFVVAGGWKRRRELLVGV